MNSIYGYYNEENIVPANRIDLKKNQKVLITPIKNLGKITDDNYCIDMQRNYISGGYMELIFEHLQEQDIFQLRDISDEFSNIEPEQVKPFLAEKQNIAFVAKLEGKIIGLLYGYSLADFDGVTSQFYIYSVDIHTKYQNNGYGSRFVQFAVEWAKNNGFRKCYVCADGNNARACRVYEKAGMMHSKNDCDRMYVVEYE